MASRGYKTARFQRKVPQPNLKSETQIRLEVEKRPKTCRGSHAARWLPTLRSRFFFGHGGLAVIMVLVAQAELRAQDFSLKTSFRP